MSFFVASGGMWRNRTLWVLIRDQGKKCTKVKVSKVLPELNFSGSTRTFTWSPESSPEWRFRAPGEGFPKVFENFLKIWEVKVFLEDFAKIFTGVKVLRSGWRFFGPIFGEWRLVKVMGLNQILSKYSLEWRFWALSEGFFGRFSASEG